MESHFGISRKCAHFENVRKFTFRNLEYFQKCLFWRGELLESRAQVQPRHRNGGPPSRHQRSAISGRPRGQALRRGGARSRQCSGRARTFWPVCDDPLQGSHTRQRGESSLNQFCCDPSPEGGATRSGDGHFAGVLCGRFWQCICAAERTGVSSAPMLRTEPSPNASGEVEFAKMHAFRCGAGPCYLR